jgi:hypothetical protein
MTTIESAPSFTLPELSAEALGELFIETAQQILIHSGGTTQARAIEGAIRTAAAFVEAIAELSANQAA